MNKPVLPKTIKKSSLNPKQELFCKLYATDQEFFANGVQSYIEVYTPEKKGNWYKSALASAARLLLNVNILARINELLELDGLNDSFVDKQLHVLINQNADFTNKLGAIREYNKLKQRITAKQDITSKGQAIRLLTYKK